MMEVFDIEQGSEMWFECRRGLPTASEFSTVMSEGRADGHLPANIMDSMVKSGCSAEQLAAAVKAAKKSNSNPAQMRRQYMRRLAGEIVTGELAEQFSNAHTERGNAMEDEARETYAFIEDAEVTRVGFIRNGNKGASPDSLIGLNGGLEIKTALPHIQIDRLEKGRLPPEHAAQVHGNIWVAEREWWDFCSYWPRLPMFKIRVYRDEEYIRKMASEVDRFNDELAKLVGWLRRYGIDKQEAA